MKPVAPLNHVIFAFVIALAVYAISFTAIEHRRTRNGPWQVSFTQDTAGAAALVIDQPKLNISGVQLTFPNEPGLAAPSVFRYSQPKEVPYAVPYGQCLFMDTTFLPGTIVFNLYGHEIQLIPRVLTIDRKEYFWKSQSNFVITNRAILDRPTNLTVAPN